MCAVIQLHSQVGLHRTAQVSTPVVWWDSLLGAQGRRRRFHRWSNLELFLFGGQAYNLWIEFLVPQILRRCNMLGVKAGSEGIPLTPFCVCIGTQEESNSGKGLVQCSC